MSWTLGLAIWGAATGTAGTATSLLNRRDAIWARRGRSRPHRADLEAIRDTLTEAKHAPERAAVLTGDLRFRTRVEAVGDAVDTCPDRQLRHHFKRVRATCLALENVAATAAEGQVSYQVTTAIDTALTATADSLGRLRKIDRRAPTS